MKNTTTFRFGLALVALSLVLGAAVGCSSDSPSEPSPTPAPPGGGTPAGSFNVTVTASAAEIAVGSPDPILITIQVRRTDNGQAPPEGTTVVLSTTRGALGTAGGGSSGVVALSGGGAIVPLFAGTSPGTAVIQAQLSNSFGQTAVQILAPDTFFLAFVSPNIGTPQGGDTVTINGGGFIAPVRVTFGTVNAQVVSTSSTQIRVITPTSPSPPTQQATVNVSVTIDVNGDDEAADTLAGAFTYRPGGTSGTPAIFSVTPNGGPNEGGTPVSIIGEGFEAPAQVLFGLASTVFVEAQIVSITPGRIEVLSPAATGFASLNQNQIVNVRVRSLNSGLQAELTSAFRYGLGGGSMFISGITPNEGPLSGRDINGQPILVTIFGNGFVSPVRVVIAPGGSEIEQDVLSVSGSEIVFRLRPITTGNCQPFSGTVQVTNLNTNERATGPTFRYLVVDPVIQQITTSPPTTPPSGPAGGGTNFTIIGQNFESPVRVLFGTSAATNVTNTTTSISGRTPAFTGTFPSTTCTTAPPASLPGTMLQRVSVNVTVTNITTGCSDTLPGAFVYVPNETCVANEAPPAPP